MSIKQFFDVVLAAFAAAAPVAVLSSPVPAATAGFETSSLDAASYNGTFNNHMFLTGWPI